MRTIVLITGGFDPMHAGHIAYLKAARELGDALIVGLNSDEWLKRKKGLYFMSADDRRAVLEELKSVDAVIEFDDEDGTAIDAIKWVLATNPGDKVVFANGGDRTVDNIPEMVVQSERLEFVFGVGGEDKKNSSSWILEEYRKKLETQLIETLHKEKERSRLGFIQYQRIMELLEEENK